MGELLAITLSVAVPLRIQEIRKKGRAWWQESLSKNREYWTSRIASKGDDLQYGSQKKGEVAKLFNETVDAIAHLAFVPGGVHFLRDHYEGVFEEGGGIDGESHEFSG